MNHLPTRADADSIESLIDHIGLAETLNIIAAVCVAKADHISTNWQDEPLAARWLDAGCKVSSIADEELPS